MHFTVALYYLSDPVLEKTLYSASTSGTISLKHANQSSVLKERRISDFHSFRQEAIKELSAM